MEIEAKFAVPDEATYRRLQECQALAGFALHDGRTVTSHDQYVDTLDGRFLAAGYACRLRAEGEAIIATLKGLGAAGGAVHRRDEREVRLSTPELDPARWPDGPARWLAEELAAGEPLVPLLELHQTRARRTILDGERVVGELTVDAVGLVSGRENSEPIPPYFELEAELKESGTEADLGILVEELQNAWGLQPEPRSKFERALAALGMDRSPAPASAGAVAPRQRRRRRLRAEAGPEVTPDERALLERYAAEDARSVARRARVVLGWAAGQPTHDLADRLGFSPASVRYWVRSFRSRRMGIFRRSPASTMPPAIELPPEPVTRSGSEPAPVPEPPVEPVAGPAPAPEPAPPPESAPLAAAPEILPGNQEAQVSAPAPAPLAADDPMAEAGRKIMYLHYLRMVQNEPGTRAGEDPEALHDMRVATRRMRAAYLLFAPYFDAKALAPYNKKLRRTGRTLGAVRDLDVLLDKAGRYLEGQPSQAQEGLALLLDDWRAQRDRARDEMLAYLDRGAYQKFREQFGLFLTTPGAGALSIPTGEPVAYQVRHVAPRLILGRYEDVRAYEPLLPDAPLATYHQLRISCKKFRYALEFFRDVLGEQAAGLIKKVTAMQDLLGNLQDASVAEGLIASFLAQAVQQHPFERRQVSLEGVSAYLAAQWATQRELLARFPDLWADLSGYDFRKGLSLAVAAL